MQDDAPGSGSALRSLCVAAAALCMGLQGCSTLRTTMLRDARVLDRGESEYGFDFSTSAALTDRTLSLARKDDDLLRAVVDSSYATHNDVSGGPLWGASYSRGLGQDMQADFGAYVGPIPWDAVGVEAGFKNRLAGNGENAVSSYLRLAAGVASDKVNIMAVHPALPGGYGTTAQLKTHTVECDVMAMATTGNPETSYVYFNAGFGGGSIFYDFRPDYDDHWEFQEKGRVDMYGVKMYVGTVMQFTEVEVTLEAGYLFMNYGHLPSIGLRASLVRPGSKH